MKRPIGLILASIVLGCFAALQLLAAALYTFLGFMMRHGLPNQPARPGMPTGPYLIAIMAFISVLLAVLAAWAIVTILGLLRLRNWARYSILVIGGCLAALGILSIFAGIFASATLLANPDLPAHTMQVAFLSVGLIYALTAAIGIWWLVYFNLRSTKAFFLPAYSLASPSTPELAYGTSVGAAPPPLPYQTPSRFAQVPTSIIVLACLFLFGALCCTLIALLPIPAFLFGFLLHRPASILLYGVFAIAAAFIGIGLLRMDNRARLGVYAFSAVGIVNFLVLLTPWGQVRYNAYQQSLYTSMTFPGVPHAIDTHALILFSAVFSLVFYGVQIWIIERHRAAFLAPVASATI